jgi:hypothetical protein
MFRKKNKFKPKKYSPEYYDIKYMRKKKKG